MCTKGFDKAERFIEPKKEVKFNFYDVIDIKHETKIKVLDKLLDSNNWEREMYYNDFKSGQVGFFEDFLLEYPVAVQLLFKFYINKSREEAKNKSKSFNDKFDLTLRPVIEKQTNK